ncbi:conjugal transfer protein TraH [Arcobacter lacus]|uniref:conjugal transfer protein TraH n=1 Tax=Arcobacter lacus TaxID=1912876 RepID=UPI0021BA76D0|nr:conjugal transfer protein TraH [Arcobacter lacus]MCT7910348.1 conjugal transfer protein TraH [Arcobacter lacus]
MKKIILITILLFSFSNASLKDFADGVINVKESGGSLKTNDRTVLYGGGYTIKVPNVTLTPFAIKAPNLKAGCGGIDMVFGSLGFLDKDQFVKFAEGIMSAAPGVAFDLALKTLCPSCSETLKALQAMANQINNMSLNSCQAATALGNTALEAIVGNTTKEELSNNSVNNFFIGMNETYLKGATDYLKDGNSWLSSLGADINKPKIIQFITQNSSGYKKSLINYLIKDVSYISGLDNNILRTITGDIVIGSMASGDNPTILNFIPSLNAEELEKINFRNDSGQEISLQTNTEKIINRLMGFGDDIPYTYNSSENIIVNDFQKGELKETYTKKVNDIAKKIVSRTSLTEDELQFLAYFKFPVYKIFNALGNNEYSQEILLQSSEKLAQMLSAQIVYELLIKVNHLIQLQSGAILAYGDRITKLAFTPKEELKNMVNLLAKDSRIGAGVAYKIYIKSYRQFIDSLNLNESIQKAKELKKMAMIRSNPDMLNNLMFLETINK